MKKLIVRLTDCGNRDQDLLAPSFPLLASAYTRFGAMRLSVARGEKSHESK